MKKKKKLTIPYRDDFKDTGSFRITYTCECGTLNSNVDVDGADIVICKNWHCGRNWKMGENDTLTEYP